MRLFRKSRAKGPGVFLIFLYDIIPPVREIEEINLDAFRSRLNLPVKVLDRIKMPGPLPLPKGFVRSTALQSCREVGIEVADPDRDIRFEPGYGLGSAHELKTCGRIVIIVRRPEQEAR